MKLYLEIQCIFEHALWFMLMFCFSWQMLSSKDINFVGYTYKNFEIVKDHQIPGIGIYYPSSVHMTYCYICIWHLIVTASSLLSIFRNLNAWLFFYSCIFFFLNAWFVYWAGEEGRVDETGKFLMKALAFHLFSLFSLCYLLQSFIYQKFYIRTFRKYLWIYCWVL